MKLVTTDGRPVFQVISTEDPQLSKPDGQLKLMCDNKRVRVRMRFVKIVKQDAPVFRVISNENPKLSTPQGQLKLVVSNKKIRVKIRGTKSDILRFKPQPLELVVDRNESLFDRLEELYSDNYSFRCNERLS